MDVVVQLEERTRFLGDLDREQRLLVLAQLGAFGHKAQPPKVHVGTRHERDKLFARAGETVRGNVALHACDGERARGLGDGARVFKDVLDGSADLVVGDAHDAVDSIAANAEALFAHDAHRRAVGEQADLVEQHALALFERLRERVGVKRLDADDFDVGRCDALDVRGDAGEQTAPPTQQKMASRFDMSVWRQISTPIVPWPAMTRGWSKGGMMVKPYAWERRVHSALASSKS